MAREFEEIAHVMQLLLPKLASAMPKVRILALRSERDLRELVPDYWDRKGGKRPAGLYRSGPFLDDVLVRLDVEGEAPFHVLYHEYAHAVTEDSMPGAPLWLEEGLAELWGSTRIGVKKTQVGRPLRAHVALLRQGSLLSLEELLTVDHASPHYNERTKASTFYAQSWALVHFLLLQERGARSPQLARYLDLRGQGLAEPAAWEQTFGDRASFEHELRRHIDARMFRYMAVDAKLDIDTAAFAIRHLSQAEADAIRGDFLQRQGYEDEARSLLGSAVEAAPELPLANESMGALLLAVGERTEALELLRRAVVLDPTRHRAHYLLAMEALSSGEARSLELAERHLVAAVTHHRRFDRALSALAGLYENRGGELEKALALRREAALAAPSNAQNHLNLARILVEVGGDADEAAGAVRFAVYLAEANGSARLSNNVCWWGALSDFAREVLATCERAVELEPGSGTYRDSRGVARAMTGDWEGAIEDFRFFLDDSQPDDDVRKERQLWIEALREGRNPIDEHTRRSQLGLGP